MNLLGYCENCFSPNAEAFRKSRVIADLGVEKNKRSHRRRLLFEERDTTGEVLSSAEEAGEEPQLN